MTGPRPLVLSLFAAMALACLSLQAQSPAPARPRTSTPRAPASRPATPRPPTPAATAAPVERPVPFQAGEQLSYDIAWSSYLTAATATVTVREKRPSFDSTAYYIVAEGRPTSFVAALYQLYYKADTLLDAFTLLPQRGAIFSVEGRRTSLRAITFDHTLREAAYEVQSGTPLTRKSEARISLPPSTQDALSAIYALRALPMKTGTQVQVPVILNGELYRLNVSIGGVESVTCGLGSISAWKITPVIRAEGPNPDERELTVYLSNDARRLPVLMRAKLPIGSFTLTLREAAGTK